MDELKYLRREVEVKDAHHVERTIEDLLYEIEWLRADNTRLRELVVNVRNKEDIWCPPIPLPIAEAGGYTRKPVETMTYDEFVDWTIAYLLKK